MSPASGEIAVILFSATISRSLELSGRISYWIESLGPRNILVIINIRDLDEYLSFTVDPTVNR